AHRRRISRPSGPACRRRDRQLEPRRPRAAAGRAAVARRRRTHRQGLAQPARRAGPPRRARRGAVCGPAGAGRDLDRAGELSMAQEDQVRDRIGAGIRATFSDALLLDGVRTPFADYNGALATVSPIDLGIKAARAALARSAVAPTDVGTVIAGSMAHASFDAFMLPRHL